MDWRRLDLNLLKVLGIMLEERSVNRTAERLFITPSAVSHALSRLRGAFADPLFVRTPGGMIPTARARALERPLSLLISSLNGPEQGEHDTFEPSRTRRALRIAAPGALEPTLIPAVMGLVRSRAPQWSLTVETFERRSYEVDLKSGRLDFVLSVGGHTPIGVEIAPTLLWQDELVAVAGRKSALYDGPDTVSLNLYLAQPQVYPVPWPVTQNYLDVSLARSGRFRTFSLSVPSYAGLGQVLETSDLIASMPDRTAAAIVRGSPTLRIIRIEPQLRSDLTLLCSVRDQKEPALNWAKGIIQEAASLVPRGIPETST
ncbi:LysR family transcriptional regulator [Microvirga makkahensis]|uniref:LysR family transcriptional regulator n=1 Tax=Microvirga makkahensis TaxID=1128670 RepID=A0A7X3MT96_9HYPH|nr:LysR family transcriptional regulator [Microvirga makkahensis]MXQ12837.1 LysR family transcriptional regulator [Microvirga makkahensis]